METERLDAASAAPVYAQPPAAPLTAAQRYLRWLHEQAHLDYWNVFKAD